MSRRTAAITGAGQGLGRDLALGLAQRGYHVYGTALQVGDVEELAAAAADLPGRVLLDVCDITDARGLRHWVEGVAVDVGDEGLDVLVNNAGVLTPGPLETTPLDAVRREFEVNVFALLAVTNGLLASLRAARGRIVHIGSMTGRFPLPFNGPSSASKAAVVAIADIHRAELAPFGVEVVMVQPGSMLTGGPAKTAALLQQVSDELTPHQRRLYGEAFARFTTALNAMQGAGLPSAEAAAQIIDAIERNPAPIRVPVGPDAEELLQKVHELPDEELDRLRLQLSGLAPALAAGVA